jgi:hypothetical protein
MAKHTLASVVQGWAELAGLGTEAARRIEKEHRAFSRIRYPQKANQGHRKPYKSMQ